MARTSICWEKIRTPKEECRGGRREGVSTFWLLKGGLTTSQQPPKRRFSEFFYPLFWLNPDSRLAAPDPRVLHSTQKVPLAEAIWRTRQKHSKSWGEAELSRRHLGSNHFEGEREEVRKSENQSMTQLQDAQELQTWAGKSSDAAAEIRRVRRCSRSLQGSKVLSVTLLQVRSKARTHPNTLRSQLEELLAWVAESKQVYSKGTIYIFMSH